MRIKWKFVIKSICLLLVLCICINVFTYVLRDKTNAEYIKPFWEEKEDTIDVIFVGSSHSYRSIYPLEIWHKYGLTSWNLGSSEQSVAASYHLIEEAIERQHPKVVVMEMYMSFVDSKYYDYARIHQITDNMPCSMNKINFIKDVIPVKDRLEFYFPIAKYHERWPEIGKSDIKKIERDSKGVEYGGGVTAFSDFEILNKNQKMDIPEVTVEYLEKAKQLCDDNDVQLLLIAVPYIATNEYEYRQKMLNEIYDIANELDVPYINMFHEINEVGINFETDFEEWQHLNISGAQKVSDYIGKYLSKNYDLSDKRTDDEICELWNKSYENSLLEQKNALKRAKKN